MTIQPTTLPDVQEIEHLDFDPECQNPIRGCANVAEWAVRLCAVCNHTLPTCDPCWQHVVARIAKGDWQGRYCSKCRAPRIPAPTATRLR